MLVLTASVLLIQTQSNTPLTEKFQPIYSNSGITGAAIGLPQEFIETPTQDESQNTENTTTTNQTTSPPELIEEKNTLQENDSENSNQNNSSNDNSTSQQVEQQQTKTQESTTNQQESNSNTKEETVSKTTSTQSTTALFQAAEVSDINETTIEWIYPTSNINVSQHELFNVTVNVTCTSGYCGEINVTLDPESTVYNFSTCTASGRNGPSQANCDTAYSGEELDGLVTVGDGIQNWTVPSSGTYTITAQGASGVQGGSGSGNGGHGTLMKGDFVLTEGDVISVLVGQLGTRDGTYGGGGGGGTFVIDSTNDDILMIAGGGGGASIRSSTYTDGRDATTSISGTNGSLDSVLDSNAPGTDGNGGSTSSNGGGAGAGYSGDGTDYQSGSGGHSYLNGAQGGDSSSGSSFGGFGGAGAGYGGGGAGGYAGSGGGGGGGGSVNNGTNQNNTVGTVEQHGYVLIELANSLKDGTIPMETNATPFYTITTNPYNITLNESESEIITWWVNATGDIDIAHEFFIYTNRTSDGLASNNTTKLNITIIDTTTPQITILYPQNTTYNSQVTELNYSYNDLNGNGVCWYSLDQGATNSSTTSTPTNISDFSANNGGNDLTL